MTDGRGDWIQTFTGRKFYPLNPLPTEIDSQDIAHALSMLCRFGGHCHRFYSVAEHCVLMSYAVAKENALWALLHDAAEAYVVDVPRPVKRMLAGYSDIEDSVHAAIFLHFDLLDLFTGGMPAEVREADARILLTEREALMPNTEHPWSQDVLEPLPVQIQAWSPQVAKRAFLSRLNGLLLAHRTLKGATAS